MIRWLFRLLVLGVVLAALYIILSPGIFKNVEANLKSQTSVSSTVVSQLETPVAAISTPAHAALNPTETATSTAGGPTATPTPNSGDVSALTYNNGNSSLLKKLMNQFPDTGVAPPKGSSYDNYRFPRKY
jgi:hypothetical protein